MHVPLITAGIMDELRILPYAYKLALMWPQIWDTIEDSRKEILNREAVQAANHICQKRMSEGKYTSVEDMNADIEMETELQKMLKFL